jgi:hypothetical protein
MELAVTLSIGFPTAKHEDVLDVDDQDYADCETDRQREDLLQEYWQEWANNYIDGGYEIITK